MGRRRTNQPAEEPTSEKKPEPERQAVNFPIAWIHLIRKLAGKQKMPSLWFLQDLIAKAAKDSSEPHPPLPWEEEQ